MTAELQEVKIGFNREAAISRLNDYKRWKENPSAYEKKETITPQEFERVAETLEQTFGEKIRDSGLASVVGPVSDDDLQLAHDINRAVAELPIDEVVIAVADMSKRSYVRDGEFINEIADSFTGLASAAKRRLTTTNGEPDDSVLVDLGNTDAEVRQKAMQTLRDL